MWPQDCNYEMMLMPIEDLCNVVIVNPNCWFFNIFSFIWCVTYFLGSFGVAIEGIVAKLLLGTKENEY
jgi:hypothetical protein